jgi:zinc transporter ZupT
MTKIATYGAVVTSILACIGFIGALVIAYLSKDQQNLGMLLGVVAGAFNTVVAFWLGSSAGSQKKDEALLPKSGSIV